MKYIPPAGSTDPLAPYITGTPGIKRGSPVDGDVFNHLQAEVLGAITTSGLTPSGDDLTQLTQAIQLIAQNRAVTDVLEFFLCWYVFTGGIHPSAKAGMVPCNGVQLANASTIYPEAFAYLQTDEGRQLCVSETEWQAAHSAVWATLADGTQIGWDNIGGVCKYVVDTSNGTIRVPDLRGMYAEAVGFDALGVGGVHGDGVRDIPGRSNGFGPDSIVGGAFEIDGTQVNNINAGYGHTFAMHKLNIGNVVPIANKFQVRSWGALACVYLGAPK